MSRPTPAPVRALLAATIAGCSGGEGDAPVEEPIESYACVHVAEGDLVDVALVREEAESITVGREPYRVILVPGETGYVAFDTAAAADLVLLLDYAGPVHAVWNGEDRVELTPGDPNPNCDADLVEVDYLSVPAGAHWLEIGPAYQATVWMMLGEAAAP